MAARKKSNRVYAPMSEERKRELSEKMKARWAERRATQQPHPARDFAVPPNPTKMRPTPPTPSPSPKSPVAAPALVSLFRSGPTYVLRVADLAYTKAATSIAQALGEIHVGDFSIVVVTPDDTRMFEMKGQAAARGTHVQQAGRTELPKGAGSVGAEDEGTETPGEWEDPQLAAAALARADDSPSEEEAEALKAEVDGAETPAQRRRALQELRRQTAPAAGHSSPCGRCTGRGVIPVLIEGGAAVEQACPVCQGKGHIQRYGAGRR